MWYTLLEPPSTHPVLLRASRRELYGKSPGRCKVRNSHTLTCHRCNTCVQTGGRSAGSLHTHLQTARQRMTHWNIPAGWILQITREQRYRNKYKMWLCICCLSHRHLPMCLTTRSHMNEIILTSSSFIKDEILPTPRKKKTNILFLECRLVEGLNSRRNGEF